VKHKDIVFADDVTSGRIKIVGSVMIPNIASTQEERKATEQSIEVMQKILYNEYNDNE